MSTKYEYYITGDDDFLGLGIAIWGAQTFTPSAAHTITSVKLKLYKYGAETVGTITVGIRAVDANGRPTGNDLCSGTMDGGVLTNTPTWYEITLGAGYNLSASIKYAIVVRAPNASWAYALQWRADWSSATYAGGCVEYSTNSGVDWTDYATQDMMFEEWGDPITAQTIIPSSIVQAVTYGTPTVQVGSGALVIIPSSIVQVIAIGTPALLYPQILSPSSIIVTIVYGTPSVIKTGAAGFIYPQSIVQQISIGSSTILKYVWHVILDGQYNIDSPAVNRAYIIGRDAYGNPVYGEAIDSTELGLVGERLDFQQELAIPTTAQAGDVASAILAKMRLTKARGVILIPPNCGQELFDVVQISDAGANQAAVTFRVVGIRFEYNPKQARYDHKLILGAP
jgi:hypothetical protein